MPKVLSGSATDGVNHSSSTINKGRSSEGTFGFRKVVSSIGEKVKGLYDWVAKAPNKPLKAFRIVAAASMAAGAALLVVAAVKVWPWVTGGVILGGGGYLAYRCMRSNSA